MLQTLIQMLFHLPMHEDDVGSWRAWRDHRGQSQWDPFAPATASFQRRLAMHVLHFTKWLVDLI